MSLIDDILKFTKSVPFASKYINRFVTNRICKAIKPRPRAFSLWSHIPKPSPIDEQGPVGEYTTWPMLTDRLYSARHLPPANQTYIDQLPADEPYDPSKGTIGNVTALFARTDDMTKGRSSSLFMFFAQWFTDSVLRIDPTDRRKNTSNHNIDLCQIYGLKESTANILRTKKDGKLRSQIINGEEYLDHLGEFDSDGKWRVKDHYKSLPYASDEKIQIIFGQWDESRKHSLYATGLERGNSSIGYVAISTIFMREHNRICDELSKRYPSWDDERLFQTARMINTVILMKLVVQDYINHIVGHDLFYLDHKFAESRDWYRTPWIALEFDLLYRWHGLVPDEIKIGDTVYDHTQYRVNNALLEKAGIGSVINAVSQQHAGKISLLNVPNFLLGAEYATIKMGRDFRLCSYNDYRELFNFDRLSSFEQLTDDKNLRDSLEKLYGNVGNIEFIVGLFAQRHKKDGLFGDLMYSMVAYDAFTQIYTNPLLSTNVYNANTFSEYGLEIIDATNTVQELVDRNNHSQASVTAKFSM